MTAPARAAAPADYLETLLLLLLEQDATRCTAEVVRRQRGMGILERHDQGILLQFAPRYPRSTYTFDLADDDRLYAADPDYLLRPIAATLGKQAEVATLDSQAGLLKWACYRRIGGPPVRLAVIGRPAIWYETHRRIVDLHGRDDYWRRILPLDHAGQPLLARCQSHVVCGQKEITDAILACSMIEDAHRSDALLCSVQAGTGHEIKLPVARSEYQALFADRDAPLLPSGRRKALLHWVSRYLRRSVAGKTHEVKRHTRGVQEFDIDGLHIRITPNEWPPA